MHGSAVQSVISPTAHPVYAQAPHIVQLYDDDTFLVEVLSQFVGDILAANGAALVIATPAHRKQLDTKLSARGLDPVNAALQGRYLMLDADETLGRFMGDGAVDETRFNDIIERILGKICCTANGEELPVAVFGEMVALLWAEGKMEEALHVEQLWNHLGKTHPFSLLCAYPISGFSSETHIEPFLKLCREHSDVAPSEHYLVLNSDDARLRAVAQLEQRAQVLERNMVSRQSDEQFRLLVDTVQDYAIFMLDPEGKISSWNVGAGRIHGYKSEEILGKHFSCFYPQEDVERGKPQKQLAQASQEGRVEDEGWRVRRDGSWFWANVVITAIRDSSGKLLGFAKITRDVTERMRAQQALHKEIAERRETQRQLHNSERSLRQLSLHLLRTQDEERRHIGRDLHDTLGQSLAVLKMKLESLAFGAQQDEAIGDLADCIRLTEDSIKEVRTVSYLLYPPMLEEMGLKSAIPWYLDGFSTRSGIETKFEGHPEFGRLPRESELALFRVLQESLTNVHRHSGSRTACIRLLIKDGMGTLEIEDKGKGIPKEILEQSGQDWTAAPRVGLRGMNERMQQLGGKFELISEKLGTTVRAMVPVQSRSAK